MTQIILTKCNGRWSYVVLTDGRPTAADQTYDSAADALGDAVASPTMVE